MENNPGYASAYVNMGSILHQMGRYHEAEISYLRALKINPADLLALKNLAVTQFSQGKYENALHYCQQLEHLDPGQQMNPGKLLP